MAKAGKENRSTKTILIVVIALAVAYFGVVLYKNMKANKIDTFDKCVQDLYKRGQGLEATNPPRCVTEDGRVFIGPKLDK